MSSNRDYYDQFAPSYEAHRHEGYHRLIDDLESKLIERYGAGGDIFEAGCGTGLLLERATRFARSCTGLDLSAGMLQTARERNLPVVQGSITDLPLPDAAFDLVYSMKVLAHIEPIESAVAELARITRPGGHVLLEFYNPYSLRYLAKKLAGPGSIAPGTNEADVFTRFDSPAQARSYLPPELEFVSLAGVRIFTPAASVFRFPSLGALVSRAEHTLCEAPILRKFGGFIILVARKR